MDSCGPILARAGIDWTGYEREKETDLALNYLKRSFELSNF